MLFMSPLTHYLVDQGGQFNEIYHGMEHELMEFIESWEIPVDASDERVFTMFKLCELTSELETVVYF